MSRRRLPGAEQEARLLSRWPSGGSVFSKCFLKQTGAKSSVFMCVFCARNCGVTALRDETCVAPISPRRAPGSRAGGLGPRRPAPGLCGACEGRGRHCLRRGLLVLVGTQVLGPRRCRVHTRAGCCPRTGAPPVFPCRCGPRTAGSSAEWRSSSWRSPPRRRGGGGRVHPRRGEASAL